MKPSRTSARRNGKNTVTIGVDVSEVMTWLNELGDDAAKVVRPAAQAGAQIFYDEARRLVGISRKPHYFYGKAWTGSGTAGKFRYEPGNLRDSIYQVYSKDNSNEMKATYHISWNQQKAPYGTFVEYGLSPFSPVARPFIRPAAVNKEREAVNAVRDAIVRALGEL